MFEIFQNENNFLKILFHNIMPYHLYSGRSLLKLCWLSNACRIMTKFLHTEFKALSCSMLRKFHPQPTFRSLPHSLHQILSYTFVPPNICWYDPFCNSRWHTPIYSAKLTPSTLWWSFSKTCHYSFQHHPKPLRRTNPFLCLAATF